MANATNNFGINFIGEQVDLTNQTMPMQSRINLKILKPN